MALKVANYDTRTHIFHYDKNRVVEDIDVMKNGYMVKTFIGEDYVYIHNGMFLRRYSDNKRQLSQPAKLVHLSEIFDEIKYVRNRMTDIIYGRKHKGMPLVKVSITKKKK